ncbi:hypothetical protein MQE23_18720 [Streptomyces sp. HP-A2021]|uniref:hypothetical protein n=1 Tax=Streptomyces sp. HP-A2021 TaxID=2927875 RepID=UPI001FAF76CD|nr:hypothetical protein [Streptomyces sp. HP-A2021]UOB10982.1 hypothetical protein MQE23_18720 [Streptomyces sp. HP-A2021]
MARRALTTTAAAFTATAALLLTACGGGGDDSSDDFKGADKGASSPSASPSGSASTDVGRPDVSLPKDLDVVFDFEKPSDQDSAAALDDAANYIRALNHGITKQDPGDSAFQFYSSGQASRYAHSRIKEYVDGGWTLTGKDRYYQAETSPDDESEKVKTVSVTFCEDQSRVYGKEVTSEKVHRTKESLASFQKFTVLMASVKGNPVWRAQRVTVEGKAEECRG